MSSLKKGFRDRLVAAGVITLGLIAYKHIPQKQPNNWADRPSNNFLSVTQTTLSKNLPESQK